MRRLMTGLLGASLLLGACGGDDDSDDLSAVTSIPDETSTSTSTTTEPRTVAPDVIPQDESQITEEYVEQVLNALLETSLQSMVLARKEGLVTESSLNLIAATTSDAVYEMRANDLLELASQGFVGLRAEPAPLRATVVRLMTSTPSCVVAEIRTDASGLIDEPAPTEPGQRNFVRLLAAGDEDLQTGLNPTAWVIDQFPVTLDGAPPEVDCESP